MLSIALYVLGGFLILMGLALGTSGNGEPNSVAIAWGFAITFLALGRMHSLLKDIRENMGRG